MGVQYIRLMEGRGHNGRRESWIRQRCDKDTTVINLLTQQWITRSRNQTRSLNRASPRKSAEDYL